MDLTGNCKASRSSQASRRHHSQDGKRDSPHISPHTPPHVHTLLLLTTHAGSRHTPRFQLPRRDVKAKAREKRRMTHTTQYSITPAGTEYEVAVVAGLSRVASVWCFEAARYLSLQKVATDS